MLEREKRNREGERGEREREREREREGGERDYISHLLTLERRWWGFRIHNWRSCTTGTPRFWRFLGNSPLWAFPESWRYSGARPPQWIPGTVGARRPSHRRYSPHPWKGNIHKTLPGVYEQEAQGPHCSPEHQFIRINKIDQNYLNIETRGPWVTSITWASVP